jgi:hypothetical protein
MRWGGGQSFSRALIAVILTLAMAYLLLLARGASANVLWGYWEVGRQVSRPTATPTVTATPSATASPTATATATPACLQEFDLCENDSQCCSPLFCQNQVPDPPPFVFVCI